MNAKTLVIIGSMLIVMSLFAPVATITSRKFSINGYEIEKAIASGTGLILILINISNNILAGRQFRQIQ